MWKQQLGKFTLTATGLTVHGMPTYKSTAFKGPQRLIESVRPKMDTLH